MSQPNAGREPHFSLPVVTESDATAYDMRKEYEAGVYETFGLLESGQPVLADEVQRLVAELSRDDDEGHHMTAVAVVVIGLLKEANKRRNLDGTTPLFGQADS
jgi:hypothetical protein